MAGRSSCYEDQVSRLRIGTCSGPADAALIRSVFSARGIDVVVGAEHHSSMLAGLGGGFLSLDIWVDEADAEEALALLRDRREHDASLPDGNEAGDEGDRTSDRTGDHDDAATGELAATGPPDDGDQTDNALEASFQQRIDRRRRTGIVLLLGCGITFGTAHMFTRAWLRGIALAAVELVGILHVRSGHSIGSLAVAAAVSADVLGAVWRVWATPPSTLPVARLRSG